MNISVKNGRDDAAAQPSYARLRDLIRADIVEGHLPAGGRLKIDELARRYESSAIPIREALQQLQGEGVVVFLPNRGASVRRIDADFLRNIHELRALTEPYLIRWFVRHRTEAQLRALVSAQEAYDRSVDEAKPDQWHSNNVVFHSICYDGHYNPEALAIAKRHTHLLHTVAKKFPVSRARALQVCREHWAIIEVVRIQNESAAAAIVEDHVRNAGQHLIERMLAAERSGS